MEQKEIFLKANPNLSLIDVLEMQKDTEIIFKARGRAGVPQKILRVHQNFCLDQQCPKHDPIHLTDGDYIAAYKTPLSETVSGAFYLARLSEKELKIIDNILKRHFKTSLAEEKKSNYRISIDNLPLLPVQKAAHDSIFVYSTVRYKSDGKSSSGLNSIVLLNKNLKFVVNATEKYTYQAHKGDYFGVVSKKHASKTKFYLIPISKDDLPAIKMQDKKEVILRKHQANNFLKLKSIFTSQNTKG